MGGRAYVPPLLHIKLCMLCLRDAHPCHVQNLGQGCRGKPQTHRSPVLSSHCQLRPAQREAWHAGQGNIQWTTANSKFFPSQPLLAAAHRTLPGQGVGKQRPSPPSGGQAVKRPAQAMEATLGTWGPEFGGLEHDLKEGNGAGSAPFFSRGVQ